MQNGGQLGWRGRGENLFCHLVNLRKSGAAPRPPADGDHPRRAEAGSGGDRKDQNQKSHR
jgi:hypothetical protein